MQTIMNLVMPWDGSTDLAWSSLALILLAYVSVRCLSLQLPLFMWVTRTKAARQRRVYKIDYKAGQFKRELRSLFGNLIFDAIFLSALIKSDLAVTASENIFSTFVFSAVIFELWFYASHRALHTRLLFPIHRLHHAAQVTSPLTAMTFSVGERFTILIGLSAGLGAISYIYPISFAGVALYFGVNYIFTLLGHTNIEIYPPSWKPILALFTTPTHHSLHHSRVNGNFGLHTRILDRLFNTEYADYLEVQKRAYYGDGLTSIAQRAHSKTDLVAEIRSGKRGLCDLIAKTELKRRYVFEDASVRQWLNQELKTFTPSLEAEPSGAWFVERNEDIHGPMSFADIQGLKKNNQLSSDDVCFSLNHKVALRAANLSEPVAAPMNLFERRALYLNRHKPRVKMQVPVQVRMGVITSQATTLDLNSQSAAVYMQSPMELERVVILELPDQATGSTIQVRATVINATPYLDGFRFGLEFNSQDRRTARARLSNFVTRNSSVAA